VVSRLGEKGETIHVGATMDFGRSLAVSHRLTLELAEFSVRRAPPPRRASARPMASAWCRAA